MEQGKQVSRTLVCQIANVYSLIIVHFNGNLNVVNEDLSSIC